MKTKLIRLKISTIHRLKRHGEFGESYDTVVSKILDKVEKKKGN